ncbi:Putative N-acetylmannosaminyltransferase [Jannaschia seosinensis]|uniref:Putative N-acetylmannosaminyltransferase n=1 Tax=Jannaschia seosinensis TaxID=313367 RepID=A0A0M7B4T0_9RHOB|nr:WecB/TagA/CpsF family glycosyltransferase [Jannaschia seosinensis]CUH20711.1 Putative N-acetylmannosaminyltransferase [Jannaschia seosinensis]
MTTVNSHEDTLTSLAPFNWIQASDTEKRVRITAPRHGMLLADLEALMSARRGFTIATLNLDHVVRLKRDADFRAAYARHTHVTADGNPIVWLSRLAGHDIDLIPGSELIHPVTEIASRHDVPVALVGSTQDALETTAQKLIKRYPQLRIVTKIAPKMGFDPTGPEADEIIVELRRSGAGLCFLAIGAPRQEIFAARATQSLPQTGFLSIGAGLDFIAGTQIRAPKIMRRFAGEWLWRLAHSPRRLARRYGACIATLPSLTLQVLRHRMSSETAS